MNTESPPIHESIPPIRQSTQIESNVSGFFSNNNNLLIFILCSIILLMLLNNSVVYFLQNIFTSIYNLFLNVLKLFGYATGTAINVSADVAGDVARAGIDISEGTLHSIGNLLENKPSGTTHPPPTQPPPPPTHPPPPPTPPPSHENKLNNAINTSSQKESHPEPDKTDNPIQNPISTNKQNWCLVGEYKGTRSCIEIDQYDKCLSGQVFPSQTMCLNPTLSKK
jgi:hypothetical protein